MQRPADIGESKPEAEAIHFAYTVTRVRMPRNDPGVPCHCAVPWDELDSPDVDEEFS